MARLPRNQRRARSALGWCLGIFLVVQVGSGLLLDYCWPLFRFPSAARILTAARRHRPADVVCLGSSRFEIAIRPDEIARLLPRRPDGRPVEVLNASVPCGDVVAGEFVLRRLLAQGVRPSLAVIEVNPETLNDYNRWLSMHIRRQFRWNDLAPYLADVYRLREVPLVLQTRLLPLYSHRRLMQDSILAALDHWLVHPEEAGPPASIDSEPAAGKVPEVAGPAAEVSGDPAARAPTPVQEATSREGAWIVATWLTPYHAGGVSVAALERTLRLCRDNGIEPILVGVPVTRWHRQNYTPAIEAAYRGEMDRLARAYGCRFVDYRDRVPDGLFKDVHHLQLEGGVYFSRMLTRAVLAPAWQARHTGGP
jgi:hypothetical protein